MSSEKTEIEYLETVVTEPVPEITPNRPYAEMQEHLAFRSLGMGGYLARARHRAQYGFVVITAEQSLLMSKLLRGKRCLEVAAGTGWLSHVLKEKGVDIVASDKGGTSFSNYQMAHVWQRQHEGDSLSLLPGEFDVVVMTWPAYDEPFASEVISAMRPGQTLFFEGEGEGGCTADDQFFETLNDTTQWRKNVAWTEQLNENHLRFSGLYDRWSVWKKLS